MAVDKRKYHIHWIDADGNKGQSMHPDELENVIERMIFLNADFDPPKYWYEEAELDHQHPITSIVMCDECGQQETFTTVEHVRDQIDEVRYLLEEKIDELQRIVTRISCHFD